MFEYENLPKISSNSAQVDSVDSHVSYCHFIFLLLLLIFWLRCFCCYYYCLDTAPQSVCFRLHTICFESTTTTTKKRKENESRTKQTQPHHTHRRFSHTFLCIQICFTRRINYITGILAYTPKISHANIQMKNVKHFANS